MMDAIFENCVRILVFLAGQTGLIYKEINVSIFVILWPFVTLGLLLLVIFQRRRIQILEAAFKKGEGWQRTMRRKPWRNWFLLI